MTLSLNKVMRTFGWSPSDLELQVSLCVSLWFFFGFCFVCFASFWFCFVLLSSSRSSCCLTFWEMSMRAVILMSGADTVKFGGGDKYQLCLCQELIYLLCSLSFVMEQKYENQYRKKGQSTTFCQELIGEIDQDGNGSISFNEFVWLMTRWANNYCLCI